MEQWPSEINEFPLYKSLEACAHLCNIESNKAKTHHHFTF